MFGLFALAYAFILGAGSEIATLLLTWLGIKFGFGFGLPVGLAVGLVKELGFTRGRTGREPERLILRLRHPKKVRRSARTYAKQVGSAFTSALVFAIVFGLGLAIAFWLLGRHELGIGMAGGFIAGLTFGLAFGLANVVVSALGDNHDLRDAITPWELLATDRSVTLARMIAAVIGIGIFGAAAYVAVFSLLFQSEEGVTLNASTIEGILAFGLVGATIRLALSAWGNWLMFACVWLPLTSRLPWRPKRFLEDAYQRGVLRQTGAVYQFRHARLRDHLVQSYRT